MNDYAIKNHCLPCRHGRAWREHGAGGDALRHRHALYHDHAHCHAHCQDVYAWHRHHAAP